MFSIHFDPTDNERIAILTKRKAMGKQDLTDYYVTPTGISKEYFVAFELYYDTKNTCKAVEGRQHLINEILPSTDDTDIEVLLVCDGPYFKWLTKNTKVEPFYGQICNCVIENYEHLKIIPIPNHQRIPYSPPLQNKIDLSLRILKDYIDGTFQVTGSDIIHFEYYPQTIEEIAKALDILHGYDELSCDIETLSLEFWNAGISTISFAWTKHEGIAFAVDRDPHNDFGERPIDDSLKIKKFLRQFFIDYKGSIVYHNAMFDLKVLTYELWMKELK